MADKVVIIGASRGQDWRLLNFYREARPKDCQLHREGSNRFFRISPIAITLSRPITRASHTRTGRTSNTFADTFDHGPGIVNQFTEKLGFLALHALPAGLRQLSHGLLGPKRGSRGRGRYGWPGGDELEDAAGLGADRASRNARLSQISCPCQTTRTRPVRNNLNVDRSDLWTEEFAFPSKPGDSDI